MEDKVRAIFESVAAAHLEEELYWADEKQGIAPECSVHPLGRLSLLKVPRAPFSGVARPDSGDKFLLSWGSLNPTGKEAGTFLSALLNLNSQKFSTVTFQSTFGNVTVFPVLYLRGNDLAVSHSGSGTLSCHLCLPALPFNLDSACLY